MLLLTAAFSDQRQSIFSLEFSPRKQTSPLWHSAATSKAAKIMFQDANVCRCETADLARHAEISMLLLLEQICHIGQLHVISM